MIVKSTGLVVLLLVDPVGCVGAGLSDLEHPCMQPKISIEAALRPTFSMKSFLSIILNLHNN
jgi:hypothetical protein